MCSAVFMLLSSVNIQTYDGFLCRAISYAMLSSGNLKLHLADNGRARHIQPFCQSFQKQAKSPSENSFAFFRSSYVPRNSCGPINLSFHVDYTALGVIVHFVLDSRRIRWFFYSFSRESISSIACSFSFLPLEFHSTPRKIYDRTFFLASGIQSPCTGDKTVYTSQYISSSRSFHLPTNSTHY